MGSQYTFDPKSKTLTISDAGASGREASDLIENLTYHAEHVDAVYLGREVLSDRELDVYQRTRTLSEPDGGSRELTIRIKVWVDRDYLEPVRAECVASMEEGGDLYLKQTFSNIVIGEELDPELFSTELPDGWTLVTEDDQ